MTDKIPVVQSCSANAWLCPNKSLMDELRKIITSFVGNKKKHRGRQIFTFSYPIIMDIITTFALNHGEAHPESFHDLPFPLEM